MTTPFLTTDSDSALLASNVAEAFWNKTINSSILPGLSGAKPIIIGKNSVPTITKRPSASVRQEGKKTGGTRMETSTKTLKVFDLQMITEHSIESVKSNAGKVFDNIIDEMGSGMARGVDLAAIHGLEASSGNKITLLGNDFVNSTTNRIEVDFSTKNADIYLWQGYEQLVAAGKGFNGLALDPQFVAKIANARDNQGRRLNPDIDLGARLTSYSGQPLVSDHVVSGFVDDLTDTGVRGFGGDWTSLHWGYAEDVEIFTQTAGDPLGNGDLTARRMVAVHANVKIGIGILDSGAFVAYEIPAAPAGE